MNKKPALKKQPAAQKAAPRKKPVQPVPEGYHTVTPYLCLQHASQALEFYKKAFGARELMRLEAPGGKIGHAEMKIGNSIIMMADEFPDMDFLSPRTRGGTTVNLHLYVRKVDEMVDGAVKAGATLLRPVKDQFYGDRTGCVRDPFGHVWYLATHTEDLSKAELRKRADAAMKEMAG
jgi:PhnB protein